jgi:hypothetical protein
MRTFKIYLKDGKKFNLRCRRFEFGVGQVVLFNSRDEETNEVFLSFRDIAAIIPEEAEEPESESNSGSTTYGIE